MSSSRPIALLTDFGGRDPYVGIMKGVILSRLPQATLFDLTHEIPPQDILQGAFALASAVAYCPADTVFVCVVDPGVGTDRAGLVVETRGPTFVAPDNGLLTLALEAVEVRAAWRLFPQSEHYLPRVSRTFHGRDVFAPVAAYLAGGGAPDRLGTPLDLGELVAIEPAAAEVHGDEVLARILYCDRFGNLVTSLTCQQLAGRLVESIELEDGLAPLHGTYHEVSDGGFLCLWGSFDRLELSQSMGSAAASLGMDVGDSVRIRLVPDAR